MKECTHVCVCVCKCVCVLVLTIVCFIFRQIFLKFLDFHLSKPNDCETNFLDIFPEQTVMPLR